MFVMMFVIMVLLAMCTMSMFSCCDQNDDISMSCIEHASPLLRKSLYLLQKYFGNPDIEILPVGSLNCSYRYNVLLRS